MPLVVGPCCSEGMWPGEGILSHQQARERQCWLAGSSVTLTLRPCLMAGSLPVPCSTLLPEYPSASSS